MKTDVVEEVCPNCSHCLVTGVACDWEPSECPLVQQRRKKERTSKYTFTGESIAAPDEFAFILSAN